jgi:hypothetical protein
MERTAPHVRLPWGSLIWNGATYSYYLRDLHPIMSPVNFSLLFPLFAAEFLTRIKLLLKPTPNTVHYILTHFKGVWNIVNNIPFLRNSIMKYVLTCKYKSLRSSASSKENNAF